MVYKSFFFIDQNMNADAMGIHISAYERDLVNGQLTELGGYALYVNGKRIGMWPPHEHSMRSAEALMAYNGQNLSIHSIPRTIPFTSPIKYVH